MKEESVYYNPRNVLNNAVSMKYFVTTQQLIYNSYRVNE